MSEFRIIEGDCLSALARLPEQSVQTCVTSPPYWGLRDYGTATWDGGDPDCDHLRQSAKSRESSTIVGSTNTQGGSVAWLDGRCGKCGAKRIDSQLGLEPTPEEYVANMVEVFREVRRVLRDDGTLWLNLGDSYAGGGGYSPGSPSNAPEAAALRGAPGAQVAGARIKGTRTPAGLKPKDLVGIPWMVAFALRADGWYLRSDIIWSKPNPMPESVTDRPTKAHEYLFLLTKGPRYFYDADAIREPLTAATIQRDKSPRGRSQNGGGSVESLAGYDYSREGQGDMSSHHGGANKRTVWTVTTQPFPGAHFATFPPKLIEPCILAGSSVGDTVLDPFNGAGTTGVVALRHDRDYTGIELNPEYAQMARERIYNDAPLLNLEAA